VKALENRMLGRISEKTLINRRLGKTVKCRVSHIF
jgi:hypothetical protein